MTLNLFHFPFIWFPPALTHKTGEVGKGEYFHVVLIENWMHTMEQCIKYIHTNKDDLLKCSVHKNVNKDKIYNKMNLSKLKICTYQKHAF